MNERGLSRSSLIAFGIGNVMVLLLFFVDFTTSHHGVINRHEVWGRDFINVWTSGKLVLAGRLDLLYDPALYQRFQEALFGPLASHNYSYPPLTLPLMAPFALLPYWLALILWLSGTGWLFLRAARPWWREATGWPSALVLLIPAATLNFWAGHYGLLMGALILFGWRALENGRPYLAGFCFGLMAIKPHLAMFVPIILLVRGERRAILAAAVTVATLAGISLLLFGPAPWHDFLTITAAMQGGMIDARDSMFGKMSTSTATALFALGASRPAAFGGQALTAAIAIAMVLHVARRGALRDVALLAGTATFLVLPYAFSYDLTISALGAAIAMTLPGATSYERVLAALGFMAAQLGMVLAFVDLPIMPLLLLALAFVQYRIARRNLPPVSPAQQAQP